MCCGQYLWLFGCGSVDADVFFFFFKFELVRNTLIGCVFRFLGCFRDFGATFEGKGI